MAKLSRKVKKKFKEVERNIDIVIRRVKLKVNKPLQKVNCNLIKGNHKFSVHTGECLRGCGEMTDKYKTSNIFNDVKISDLNKSS